VTNENNSGDTIKQLDIPYSFSLQDVSDYDLKIIAHFQDGSTDSVLYNTFASTHNEYIQDSTIVDVDNETNWKLEGDDFREVYWEIANVGAYGLSNKSYMINTLENNSGSQATMLSMTTGPIDISNLLNPEVSFDCALTGSYESSILSEILTILVSDDCGDTFVEVFQTRGDSLATSPADTKYETEGFVPAADQWGTRKISLAAYEGKKDVIVRLEYNPFLRNIVYLDNIMINGKAISNTIETVSQKQFSLYPNPATSTINVSGESIKKVKIYSVLGKLVLETGATENIDVSKLEAGAYTVVVEQRNNVSAQVFIKK
jgi:hypothetical protein